MKQAYIITIDLGGEDSVYFTEMTDRQANQVKALLRQSHEKFSVLPVRKSPGFHAYGALMKDLDEFVDVRYR